MRDYLAMSRIDIKLATMTNLVLTLLLPYLLSTWVHYNPSMDE